MTLGFKMCIMMNVTVPKLEYAEVWEGSATLVKLPEIVRTIAAKKCASMLKSATSSTVLRAELRM